MQNLFFKETFDYTLGHSFRHQSFIWNPNSEKENLSKFKLKREIFLAFRPLKFF